VRREQSHDRDELFARTGKHDEIGNATVRRQSIHRVRDALGARLTHVSLTDDR